MHLCFIGNTNLIGHLETECNYFISKASILNKEKYEKIREISNENYKNNKTAQNPEDFRTNNLTVLIINKLKSTPLTESYDRSFVVQKMETNYSLQTKKPDRFPKITTFKTISTLKENEEPSMELGSVPMKSNLTCMFSYATNKNQPPKTFIAYRMNTGFSIMVKEISNLIIKKLEGHKDHISEIKFFRTEKDEGLLYSSSFDNSLIIWSMDTFTRLSKIDFESWVMSASIVYLKKVNLTFVFVCGGYYKKYPVKVYNLANYALEYELKITENVSCEIIETFVDEEAGKYYLFIGCDNEKPKLLWYDFKSKALLGTFPATANVTSINIDYGNKALYLIYTDSNGVLKQIDLNNGKISIDFKVGSPVLDCIIWDCDYLICTGNPKDNSIKLLTRCKTKISRSLKKITGK